MGTPIEIYRSGPPVHFQNILIASGATISAALEFSGNFGSQLPCGIQLPSNIDSATSLTYQVSYDGATYTNFYDGSGTEYTTTVSTSRSVLLNPADFYGVRGIKVRLGTSGSPVTATADRTLILGVRP
jgi:hypothetical protein